MSAERDMLPVVTPTQLRDWFAGQALQGLISSRLWGTDGKRNVDSMVAGYSYALADAMLAEREKK